MAQPSVTNNFHAYRFAIGRGAGGGGSRLPSAWDAASPDGFDIGPPQFWQFGWKVV